MLKKEEKARIQAEKKAKKEAEKAAKKVSGRNRPSRLVLLCLEHGMSHFGQLVVVATLMRMLLSGGEGSNPCRKEGKERSQEEGPRFGGH